MAKDPFDLGEKRTKGEGENMAWWHPRDTGLRIVGRVDGVFSGAKVTFVKLCDAVVFRTADHKPLARYAEVAMDVRDAKVRASDAGAYAIVTTVGTREGKKQGVKFVVFETRLVLDAEERARIDALLARADAKLSEEQAHAPLPSDDDDDDDDLPF